MRNERGGGQVTSDGVDQFRLCPCELSRFLKPLDRLVDVARLQAQLGEGRDGHIAVGVDLERFFAQGLGLAAIPLPLEDGEGLVDEREDVSWFPAAHQHRQLITVDRDPPVLVQLECPVKSLDTFRELLLVQKELPTGRSIRLRNPSNT